MDERFLIYILFLSTTLTLANDKIQHEMKAQKSECKNIFWPMGMGLIRSFELGDEKKCIYNTIDGQVTISFDKTLKVCRNIKNETISNIILNGSVLKL